MRYYVYVLLDDRKKGSFCNDHCDLINQPFYIGKGDRNTKNKSERHLTHYKDVLLGNKSSEINPYKTNIIKKLFNLGYEPNFQIVFESNDENEAFNVEKELIEFYGRFIDGGVLTNITIGGSGGDTFTNTPNKEEIRIKRIHSEELRKHGCTEDDTKIYQCFLYNIIFSVLWNRE
jgi:hypothetical protein